MPVANLPITSAKLRDINKQLKFIPTQYQSLYRQLTSAAVSAHPEGDGDEYRSEDEESQCLEVCQLFVVIIKTFLKHRNVIGSDALM